MRRSIIVIATLVLAAAVYVANFGLWGANEVLDEEAFTEAAMASFTVEGSYAALGDVITRKVIAEYPSLEAFEPIFNTLFTALIATEPFEPALEDVSRQVHAVVLQGSGAPVTIDLADYRLPVLDSVALLSPDLAERIPDEIFRTFVIFEAGELRDVSEPAGTAVTAGWVAVGIVVALVLMLILFTQRVSVSFVAIGIALVLGALASAVIVPLARETARTTTTNDAYRTLGLNLFDELVRSLSLRTWVIGLAGLVMIVVGLLAFLGERRRRQDGSAPS